MSAGEASSLTSTVASGGSFRGSGSSFSVGSSGFFRGLGDGFSRVVVGGDGWVVVDGGS